MNPWNGPHRWLSILIVALVAAAAQVQAAGEFAPAIGQPGKDVIWVPSPQALVDKMLDMAKVTSEDLVIDLGSGDGRTVISAAKRGARALGIEYNPDMVAFARRNAEKAGVGANASFVQADIFQSELTRATVITLFLLTDLNLKLRPTLLSLKPGTRIVSNSFRMGDWEPDDKVEVACDTFCTAYLWIVPARVAGTWQSGPGELTLRQEFQKITGTLSTGNLNMPIADGKLRGDEISFVAGGAQYRGRVGDNGIEGTVTSGTVTSPWRIRR